MNIEHKIILINGIKTCVIFVEYPYEYEFSLDFDSIKKNVSNVSDKIRNYIFKNVGSISNDTVLLVLNGVIVGTLMVSGLVNQAKAAKTTPRD